MPRIKNREIMETRNEQVWQELVEAKDFDQLSNAEKAFVLGISTESNYCLERTTLLESRVIYAEAEPRPLILEKEKKGIVVPLYQTLISTAAAFVLGFLLFKSAGTSTEIVQVQPMAVTDTVYVEKQITDTVFQTKTEYIQLAAKNVQSVEVQECKNVPSSVLSNDGSFETDLSAATLANRGKSASNDETFVIMQDWSGPN